MIISGGSHDLSETRDSLEGLFNFFDINHVAIDRSYIQKLIAQARMQNVSLGAHIYPSTRFQIQGIESTTYIISRIMYNLQMTDFQNYSFDKTNSSILIPPFRIPFLDNILYLNYFDTNGNALQFSENSFDVFYGDNDVYSVIDKFTKGFSSYPLQFKTFANSLHNSRFISMYKMNCENYTIKIPTQISTSLSTYLTDNYDLNNVYKFNDKIRCAYNDYMLSVVLLYKHFTGKSRKSILKEEVRKFFEDNISDKLFGIGIIDKKHLEEYIIMIYNASMQTLIYTEEPSKNISGGSRIKSASKGEYIKNASRNNYVSAASKGGYIKDSLRNDYIKDSYIRPSRSNCVSAASKSGYIKNTSRNNYVRDVSKSGYVEDSHEKLSGGNHIKAASKSRRYMFGGIDSDDDASEEMAYISSSNTVIDMDNLRDLELYDSSNDNKYDFFLGIPIFRTDLIDSNDPRALLENNDYVQEGYFITSFGMTKLLPFGICIISEEPIQNVETFTHFPDVNEEAPTYSENIASITSIPLVIKNADAVSDITEVPTLGIGIVASANTPINRFKLSLMSLIEGIKSKTPTSSDDDSFTNMQDTSFCSFISSYEHATGIYKHSPLKSAKLLYEKLFESGYTTYEEINDYIMPTVKELPKKNWFNIVHDMFNQETYDLEFRDESKRVTYDDDLPNTLINNIIPVLLFDATDDTKTHPIIRIFTEFCQNVGFKNYYVIRSIKHMGKSVSVSILFQMADELGIDFVTFNECADIKGSALSQLYCLCSTLWKSSIQQNDLNSNGLWFGNPHNYNYEFEKVKCEDGYNLYSQSESDMSLMDCKGYVNLKASSTNDDALTNITQTQSRQNKQGQIQQTQHTQTQQTQQPQQGQTQQTQQSQTQQSQTQQTQQSQVTEGGSKDESIRVKRRTMIKPITIIMNTTKRMMPVTYCSLRIPPILKLLDMNIENAIWNYNNGNGLWSMFISKELIKSICTSAITDNDSDAHIAQILVNRFNDLSLNEKVISVYPNCIHDSTFDDIHNDNEYKIVPLNVLRARRSYFIYNPNSDEASTEGISPFFTHHDDNGYSLYSDSINLSDETNYNTPSDSVESLSKKYNEPLDHDDSVYPFKVASPSEEYTTYRFITNRPEESPRNVTLKNDKVNDMNWSDWNESIRSQPVTMIYGGCYNDTITFILKLIAFALCLILIFIIIVTLSDRSNIRRYMHKALNKKCHK